MGLPTTAPAAWLLTAGGRQSVLDFRNRLHIRDDNASAWKLGGGLSGSLDGAPVLAFGIGLGGLSFAQVLTPDMSRIRIFRSTWVDGGFGGEFREYFGLPGSGYTVKGPWPWVASPSGADPWQLPVRYLAEINDGGFGAYSYTIGSEDGSVGDTIYLDEMDTGYRQVWGQTVATLNVGYKATSIVGYMTQPLHRREGQNVREAIDVIYRVQRGPLGFVRPLDTNFNRFQVLKGYDERWNKFEGSSLVDFEGSFFSRAGDLLEIDSLSGAQNYVGEWKTKAQWMEEY